LSSFGGVPFPAFTPPSNWRRREATIVNCFSQSIHSFFSCQFSTIPPPQPQSAPPCSSDGRQNSFKRQ
jgi:hypothetical protein